jgi:hypothetical protein
MTETTQNFLKLLFNEGETISVSPHVGGYHSVEQSALNGDIHLIPPDEEKPPITIKEKDINLIAINPIKGYRRDENVTAFRTFLIENDKGTLEEQKKYIDESGIPYSACVFSGNKSLHFAIVLAEDLPSESVWRWFNQWILNILTKVDQQVKNPSRSIRFPGNMRRDGKKLMQSLVVMNGRIKQEDFFRWIYKYENLKPAKEKKFVQGSIYHNNIDASKVPEDIVDLLKGQITESRNDTWFYVACRLAKVGFDIQHTVSYLEQFFQEDRDFKRREWETCIKSAYKRVQGGFNV